MGAIIALVVEAFAKRQPEGTVYSDPNHVRRYFSEYLFETGNPKRSLGVRNWLSCGFSEPKAKVRASTEMELQML